MTSVDPLASGSVPLGADLQVLGRLVEASLFDEDGELDVEIGRYRLRRRLGSGGMGIVYEAVDGTLDRPVAIKVLRGGMESRHRQRLRREAMVLAKLTHPNVVQVYDVGEHEERPFIAMELVDGRDLRRWLTDARRSPEGVLSAFGQAGRGLQAAHEQGLVHRDFKPANVLVDAEGRVRVADFGLALGATTAVDAEDIPGGSGVDMERSASPGPLTETGAMLGTPSYMAPEQWLGRRTDARSDQFAFCVALYEALYGERPFSGQDRDSLLARIEAGPPKPPAGSGVPRRVFRALERGLRLRPEERWSSMAALLRALEHPGRRWGRMFVLLGAIVVTALAWPRPEVRAHPCDDGSTALDLVWSEARVQGITRHLEGVGTPWAKTTASSTERALVEFAREWNAVRAEVCEEGDRDRRSEAELDMAMICLQQRVGELDSRMKVLERADSKVAARSVELISGMESLKGCGRRQSTNEGLAKSQSSRWARELRTELEDVGALVAAGRYQDAESQLENLERAVATGDDPYLRAEVMVVRANLLEGLGDAAAAVETWEASYWLAQELGHEAMQAAVLERMPMALFQVDREQMPHWLAVAESFVERSDGSARLRSAVELAKATAAIRRGDYEEGLRRYQDLLEQRRSARGANDIGVLRIEANYGGALLSSGRHEEGLLMLREVSDIGTTVLGTGHAMVLANEQNLCAWQGFLGRYRDAIGSCRRAHGWVESALGDQHPQTTRAATNLAVMERELGMLERAQTRLEKVVRIDASMSARNALAETLRLRGDPNKAIEIAERVVARAAEHRSPAESWAWSESFLVISEALMDQRRYQEAARRLEYGMGLVGSDKVMVLEIQLGRVRLEQRRYDEALPLLSRHEELARLAPTDTMFLRALALVGLTRLAQETGRPPLEILALASKADELIGPMQGVRADELREELARLRRLASPTSSE